MSTSFSKLQLPPCWQCLPPCQARCCSATSTQHVWCWRQANQSPELGLFRTEVLLRPSVNFCGSLVGMAEEQAPFGEQLVLALVPAQAHDRPHAIPFCKVCWQPEATSRVGSAPWHWQAQRAF